MTREERSIRRVPLPRGRGTPKPDEVEDSILYEREEVDIEEVEEAFPRPWRRIFLWGTAAFFVILLIIALSTSFTGAKIIVTPKAQNVAVATEFTAVRGDTTGKLSFQTLPIDESSEVVIPADTMKKVSERATGTIIIYNAFSDKPQRLIKNTRFETPSGLIYRIGTSVTVPGKTVKNGRPVPGSIEAVVSADSPGVEYNTALSDFTIPGFKTDPARFASFYARSKTPLSGGMNGTIKTPSDAAIEAARVTLRDTLQKKVLKDKQALVPSGYILFPGAITTKDEPLTPEARGEGRSAVRERITGAAYLFKKTDIAQAVAQALVPSFDKLPVEIPDIGALSFQLTEPPTGNLAEVKTLRFTLTGNAKIVWQFDGAKLQSALVGKPKDDLAATLAAFPTIEKADLILKPFWSRSFPSNPKQVVIEVEQ
ncbi:MAG: hypothetical protein UY50_C0025G0019 [Parcubacteria group bacterium GW2011_GWA2_49_9]|nr:MAG: hypothetical protein UY50_C0025G0019 [Parcubacteria group bacterium GW2011_GWA2_49_9]